VGLGEAEEVGHTATAKKRSVLVVLDQRSEALNRELNVIPGGFGFLIELNK